MLFLRMFYTINKSLLKFLTNTKFTMFNIYRTIKAKNNQEDKIICSICEEKIVLKELLEKSKRRVSQLRDRYFR